MRRKSPGMSLFLAVRTRRILLRCRKNCIDHIHLTPPGLLGHVGLAPSCRSTPSRLAGKTRHAKIMGHFLRRRLHGLLDLWLHGAVGRSGGTSNPCHDLRAVPCRTGCRIGGLEAGDARGPLHAPTTRLGACPARRRVSSERGVIRSRWEERVADIMSAAWGRGLVCHRPPPIRRGFRLCREPLSTCWGVRPWQGTGITRRRDHGKKRRHCLREEMQCRRGSRRTKGGEKADGNRFKTGREEEPCLERKIGGAVPNGQGAATQDGSACSA